MLKVNVKPCPFCGNRHILKNRHDGDERDGYSVTATLSCTQCGCTITENDRRKPKDIMCSESYETVLARLIEKWNTRA